MGRRRRRGRNGRRPRRARSCRGHRPRHHRVTPTARHHHRRRATRPGTHRRPESAAGDASSSGDAAGDSAGDASSSASSGEAVGSGLFSAPPAVSKADGEGEIEDDDADASSAPLPPVARATPARTRRPPTARTRPRMEACRFTCDSHRFCFSCRECGLHYRSSRRSPERFQACSARSYSCSSSSAAETDSLDVAGQGT